MGRQSLTQIIQLDCVRFITQITIIMYFKSYADVCSFWHNRCAKSCRPR